ncbi:MAG: hypothetical protein J3Q66DRAFT_406477 [Benniella sp.]|nr:MAG: hypothetical protein J3Q66DRAFT_406477 [Benniella sp.]
MALISSGVSLIRVSLSLLEITGIGKSLQEVEGTRQEILRQANGGGVEVDFLSESESLSKWIVDIYGLSGLKAARLELKSSRTIQDVWPSVDNVMKRTFGEGSETYDDVCQAVAKEPDQLDPIVTYCSTVLRSYMHHFTFAFDDTISKDLQEREAFVDCTWSFIRTALTIAKVRSRMLEIPIEAQIYGATLGKKEDDALKTKRAIRDSWVSQIRRICETSKPTTPLMVFGSTAQLNNTRFYVMDFMGCFRVTSIGTMVIPVDEKEDFANRMKACMITCLKFALAILNKMENRKKATFVMEEDETLKELSSKIPETSMSPIKYSNA